MTSSPDEPSDSTPEEGRVMVPDELQPETQGGTPTEAEDGPKGEGDLDATAHAEKREHERLAAGGWPPEQSPADGTRTEEGLVGEQEGGPTEQGYGETGLQTDTSDDPAPDHEGFGAEGDDTEQPDDL